MSNRDKLNSDMISDLKEHGIYFMGSHFEKSYTAGNNELVIKVTYKKPKPKQLKTYINHLISEFDNKIKHIDELIEYSLLPKEIAYKEINKLFKEGKSISKVETYIENQRQIQGIYNDLLHLTQSNDYPDVFNNARKTKRKIIAYLGDTNSGKTYHALQELKKSVDSVYTAPLRLLALENYKSLNEMGIRTNLITGEEKIFTENAECTSCTVECFDTEMAYETVIIDEIQMIDDPQRGAFFTQALIGADADNIIVTGPKEYRGRLEAIAKYLNEEIEVHVFERRTELSPTNKPVKYEDIKPNTAIVAFSKKDLYDIQRKLPKHLTSTLLYGSLGSEVRREQSERFANGEVDVVITTDCVGMGLNLPIENVVFTKTEKYDGENVTSITTMLTKQIAGRAGRYGIFEKGYYSGVSKSSHEFVCNEVPKKLKVDVHKPLYVLPPEKYVRILSEYYNLSHILEAWADKLSFEDSLFQTTGLENQIMIAKYLEKNYQNNMVDFWRLIYCPIDFLKQTTEFKNIVKNLIVDRLFAVPNYKVEYMNQGDLELYLREMSMVKWFHNHYSEFFSEDAEDEILMVVNDINRELNKRLMK